MRNYFLFLLLSFILVSCNSDDDSTQNTTDPILATVFIDPIINFSGDLATVGGDVVDDGGVPIALKGICYSTSPNPDLGDTVKGAGEGASAFTLELAGLEFNTTYYVRAFANNAAGTAFSEELSFTTTNECSTNIFEGNVKLRNQADVNAFGAMGYCAINGMLDLTEPISGGSDFITDLAPLNNLRSVTRLSVYNTHELTDLTGLENLTVVEEAVLVYENQVLVSLDGIDNISSSLNKIGISNNDRLENIDGLLGITTLYKPEESNLTVSILGNPFLSNIDGLSNINDVDESITIAIGSSNAMTHLDGLSNISGTVRSLGITGISNLSNLNGLSGITTVTINLRVNNNFDLKTLSGLDNLTFVGGELGIHNNFDLRQLDALSSLDTVGGNLSIWTNGLTDFCGLQNLLINDGLGGNYSVIQNVFNPTQQDIIDGNCSL